MPMSENLNDQSTNDTNRRFEQWWAEFGEMAKRDAYENGMKDPARVIWFAALEINGGKE